MGCVPLGGCYAEPMNRLKAQHRNSLVANWLGFGCCLAGLLALPWASGETNVNPIPSPNRPATRIVRVSAHRGANRLAPENTLPAFQAAIDLGADFIEIDVRTTRDARLVLCHNRTVDATSNGRGAVRDLSFDELRQLDFAAKFSPAHPVCRIPTLRETLALARGHIEIYLDHKDAAPAQVVEELRAERMLERVVIYGSEEVLRQYRAIEPSLRLMPPLGEAADWEWVKAFKPYAVDADWSQLSAELIERCHQTGVKVFSDALDDHEREAEYLRAAKWGIDAIQTDDPARVLRALGRTPAQTAPRR